jgi:hypothetical protein
MISILVREPVLPVRPSRPSVGPGTRSVSNLGGETTRRDVRGQSRPGVAEGLQGGAAVEETRGERLKAKSTLQREHDATAAGWGMAEGVSVNHFPFELVATATVFDVVETSVA